MNDMQAVREAASRMVAGDLEHMYGVCIEDTPQQLRDDVESVARAYLDLADPTPLTVEKLVEAGFKPCRIDGHFSRGILEAARIGKGFDFWVGDTPLQLPPRTVGHLRQLLLRMGEQS